MSQNAELTRCQTLKEPVVIQVKEEQVFGVIHRPLVEEKTPALLMLHGFGSSKVGKNRLSYNLAEELASSGQTVLRIDFRGCGDSDRHFNEMTITTQIEDGLAALNWLAKDPKIDPQRIGLMGRSLGGAIAVKCAAKFPIKALALWVPFFASTQNEQGLKDHSPDQPVEISGKRPGREFLKEIMGLNVTDSLLKLAQIPLFQVYAGKDKVLEPSHREGYSSTRGEGLKEDRYMMLSEADHTFSRYDDQQKILEETQKWLTRLL